MYNLRVRAQGTPITVEDVSDDSNEAGTGKVTKKPVQAKKKRGPKERIIHCNFCPQICRTPQGLKAHLLSHTGEKPFSCEECGKKFSCRRDLKNHLQAHDERKINVTVSAVKDPYFCEHCYSIFTKKIQLIRHQRGLACKKAASEGPVEIKIED